MRLVAIAVTTTAVLCAACSSGGTVTAGRGAVSESSAVVTTAPSTTPTTAPTTAPPPAHTTGPSEPAAVPDACAHNALAQRVIVDISAQHLWMCTRGRTAYQSAVTTGAVDLAYDSTPLGTFHVQARNRDTTLTLADGSTYRVHYWVPFDAPLFGFHDADWQTIPYGSPAFRTKGSHGCVHVPLAVMGRLYRWAAVGTAVTIRA